MPELDAAKLGETLRHFMQQVEPTGTNYFDDEALTAIADALARDVAVQTWVTEQMAQMKIKAMDFRKGISMELEPAQDMVAMWVAAARRMLMEAENYTETTFVEPPNDPNRASYSMDVAIPELPERYTLTVQRVGPGKLTPHEGRMRAERALGEVWQWIADANDGLGRDTGDLASILERGGFPAPEED